MTINLLQDGVTGRLSIPESEPLSSIVEVHGQIDALTVAALGTLFSSNDRAQPGDLIYVDGIPYRMRPGTSNALLVDSWVEDSSGGANWPSIDAAVDSNITITSDEKPSFIFLRGGTQTGGANWITTWDVSNAKDGAHQRVLAIGRDQPIAILGATEILDEGVAVPSPIIVPSGKTLTLHHQFVAAPVVAINEVITVDTYAEFYTQNRDDGTQTEAGDIGRLTADDGTFAAGLYIREGNQWNQYVNTGGAGGSDRRTITLIRGGGGTSISINSIFVTAATAPDTSNLVWKVWIQKAADNSFIEAFLRVSDTEYMSVGRIA